MKNIVVIVVLSLTSLSSFAEENCYVGQVWGRGQYELLNIKAEVCEVKETGFFYLKNFGCQDHNLTGTTCVVPKSYGCQTLQFWGETTETANDDLKQFKVKYCPDALGILRAQSFACVDHNLSGVSCASK